MRPGRHLRILRSSAPPHESGNKESLNADDAPSNFAASFVMMFRLETKQDVVRKSIIPQRATEKARTATVMVVSWRASRVASKAPPPGDGNAIFRSWNRRCTGNRSQIRRHGNCFETRRSSLRLSFDSSCHGFCQGRNCCFSWNALLRISTSANACRYSGLEGAKTRRAAKCCKRSTTKT